MSQRHCVTCATQARGWLTVRLGWGRWAAPLASAAQSSDLTGNIHPRFLSRPNTFRKALRGLLQVLYQPHNHHCPRPHRSEATGEKSLGGKSVCGRPDWAAPPSGGSVPAFRVFVGALHLLPHVGLFPESVTMKQFALWRNGTLASPRCLALYYVKVKVPNQRNVCVSGIVKCQ